jgi:hypothetical protein
MMESVNDGARLGQRETVSGGPKPMLRFCTTDSFLLGGILSGASDNPR